MKVKKFNSINEAAKKPETVELEKKAMAYIMDELKKVKLCRSEIITKIEDKFKKEEDASKVARSVADDITTKKKDGVKVESYMKLMKNNKSRYNTAFFFVGSDAKEPTRAIKKVVKPKSPKSTKKASPVKESKIFNFKDFKATR